VQRRMADNDDVWKSELGQQLLEAARKGVLEKVEALLAQGADIEHTDTAVDVSAIRCI
jgi:hypothetical protein